MLYVANTFNSLQQRFQRRLATNNDINSTARQHRNIADKLNHVAQSLLGPEQKGAAGQIAAVPCRGWANRIGLVSKAAAFQPPFKFGESPLPVASCQHSNRLIEVRLGPIGSELPERDRTTAGLHRIAAIGRRFHRPYCSDRPRPAARSRRHY